MKVEVPYFFKHFKKNVLAQFLAVFLPVNKPSDHLRKKKIPVSDIPDEERFSSHFISTDNVEEKLEDKDLDDMVLKLIGQLPVQYKTVLTLYHLDGKSYPEIGEITGMPEGTVKNYLFRARNLLKEKVKKYFGKEDVL